MHDIFISYSRKDKDFVHDFVKEIEQECLAKCWIDLNGIESGEQFGRKIQKAIEECQIVLFMMSESSLQSEWTEKEVRYAKNINRRLVPVLLPGEKLSGWFLFEFGNFDCISIEDPTQKSKLINNIKNWTGFEEKQSVAKAKKEEEERKAEAHIKAIEEAEARRLAAVKALEETEKLRKAAEEAAQKAIKEAEALAALRRESEGKTTLKQTSAQPATPTNEIDSIKDKVEEMEKQKAFVKYRHGTRNDEGLILLLISILLFAATLVTIIIGWISGWVNHPNVWIKSHMAFLWSMLITSFILIIIGTVLSGFIDSTPEEYKKEFDVLIRKEKLEKGSFRFYFARKSFGEYFWTILIALAAFAINYYFYFHHWPFLNS